MPHKPEAPKGNAPAALTAEALDAKPSNHQRNHTVNSKATPANDQQATDVVPLIPVLFDQDTLILVEHNGQPYVVMKPLVTAMGLDWASQFVKIGQKFESTVVEITTVGEDGRLRTMICIPLRKLPGWLYSLNPGKVAPHLRAKVVRYQDECDEVLWRHWTGTYTPTHSTANLGLSRLNLSYEREHTRVCLELSKCTELGLGDALFDKYQRLCALLGAKVIKLDDLAPGLRQKRLALEGAGS